MKCNENETGLVRDELSNDFLEANKRAKAADFRRATNFSMNCFSWVGVILYGNRFRWKNGTDDTCGWDMADGSLVKMKPIISKKCLFACGWTFCKRKETNFLCEYHQYPIEKSDDRSKGLVKWWLKQFLRTNCIRIIMLIMVGINKSTKMLAVVFGSMLCNYHGSIRVPPSTWVVAFLHSPMPNWIWIVHTIYSPLRWCVSYLHLRSLSLALILSSWASFSFRLLPRYGHIFTWHIILIKSADSGHWVLHNVHFISRITANRVRKSHGGILL